MREGSHASFSEVVSEVLANKSDQLLHVLVLTYEFDEQQLLNLVASRDLEEDFELQQMQLKLLSDIRPVVIYDARKTRACNKLPQFLELHPYKTAGFSCHHSKAYLLVTEQTVRLVLGSFNLTATGIFKNREVFEHFIWDESHRENIALLSQWAAFLANAYASRVRASSRSALKLILQTIEQRLADWPAIDKGQVHEYQLLHSGYLPDQNGMNQLRSAWERWYPDEEPVSVLAVSPFFDITPQNACMAKDLRTRFPELSAMTLVTDQSVITSLSKAHFAGIEVPELLQIPAELGQAERERIEALARLSGNSIKDQKIARKLHAKILLLQSSNHALLYFGSGNFTRKAWQGANQELGLVAQESSPQQTRINILRSLGVEDGNLYAQLPDVPSAQALCADDEAYEEDTDFPGFIETIQLLADTGASRVRFCFEFGARGSDEEGDALANYSVDWAGIRLTIVGKYSQWIERQEFQNRLVGGRNISFRKVGQTEFVFWFPFQYMEEMIAEREVYLLPSSLDWMNFYLNPNPNGSGAPGVYVPGDAAADSTEFSATPQDGPDRDSNCVIAMQSYLTLFSRIENDFYKRTRDACAFPAAQAKRQLSLQVIDPLSGLGRLLEREALARQQPMKQDQTDPSDLFKLGELLLLVNALCAQSPTSLRPGFAPLQKQLRQVFGNWKPVGALQAQYMQFFLQQEEVPCAH